MAYGDEITITAEGLRRADKWFLKRCQNIKRICELNILLGLPINHGFWVESNIHRFDSL